MSVAALSVKTLRGPSLRAAVFERDKGICALCLLDTEALRRHLFDLRDRASGDRLKMGAWLEMMRAIGASVSGPLWEADHVRPVSAGGDSSLSNHRTLCVVGKGRGCHGKVTAELRAQLKRKPSRLRAQKRKGRSARRKARR